MVNKWQNLHLVKMGIELHAIVQMKYDLLISLSDDSSIENITLIFVLTDAVYFLFKGIKNLPLSRCFPCLSFKQ